MGKDDDEDFRPVTNGKKIRLCIWICLVLCVLDVRTVCISAYQRLLASRSRKIEGGNRERNINYCVLRVENSILQQIDLSVCNLIN